MRVVLFVFVCNLQDDAGALELVSFVMLQRAQQQQRQQQLRNNNIHIALETKARWDDISADLHG